MDPTSRDESSDGAPCENQRHDGTISHETVSMHSNKLWDIYRFSCSIGGQRTIGRMMVVRLMAAFGWILGPIMAGRLQTP